ncbi:MAG: TolC family outer membrane protein [Desulfobacteraceae bacterium]
MHNIYHACNWLKKFVLVSSVVFLSLLFGMTATFADVSKPSSPVTLHEVLMDVIKTDPEILEAKQRYESIKSERSIAKSGYLPKVGVEITAGPEVTDGVDSNEVKEELFSSRATLYARQNLFNGGYTSAYVDETDARILAAAYEVITVANRVFLKVAEAYIDVLKTRELLEFSWQNILTQEKILSQVNEKTEAGFTRLSDLSNSKARLSLAKSNYISRQQDLRQAVVKFHRQFGRLLKPEQFVVPEPAFKFPEDVEKTVDIGFNHHPALEVAKYNIHARKYTYEKAEAEYWPTLDLELRAEHRIDTNGERGDTDQAAALLKLKYEFFDGGARKGRKSQAYNQMHKEYQRAYTERRNVNETIRLAWNIYEAEKQKEAFLKDHLELSAETMSAFKDEYHVGRRTLLDLLNMENEFIAAKNANTESQFTNLTAYYRISQATGVLIHEYDTNLVEELGLPPEKLYDLDKYDELDPNRDSDAVKDVSDQCDNSIKGADVGNSGCFEEKFVPMGYRKSDKDLTPYILPDDMPEQLDLKIDKTKETQSIHLDIIHFHFDSAELTDESLEMMIPIAEQLKDAPDFMIEVIGHTDSIGTEAYNQYLSEQRAASVYNELIRLGVSKERLTTSGKGELEPVADNMVEEGRQKNRRTEFKLTKKPAG